MRKTWLAAAIKFRGKNRFWMSHLQGSCWHKQLKFRISVLLIPIFELKFECFISMPFISMRENIYCLSYQHVQTASNSNNPYVDSAALSFVQLMYCWPSMVNHKRSHEGYNTEIRPYILHSEPISCVSTVIRHHKTDY